MPKKNFHLSLEPATHRRLRTKCAALGMPVGDLIEALMDTIDLALGTGMDDTPLNIFGYTRSAATLRQDYPDISRIMCRLHTECLRNQGWLEFFEHEEEFIHSRLDNLKIKLREQRAAKGKGE